MSLLLDSYMRRRMTTTTTTTERIVGRGAEWLPLVRSFIDKDNENNN